MGRRFSEVDQIPDELGEGLNVGQFGNVTYEPPGFTRRLVGPA